MALCMSDWVALDTGVYLHQWRPELMIVQCEMMPNPGIARCLDHEQWEEARRYVYEWCVETFPDVRKAGVRLVDVRLVKEVAYVA